MREGKLGRAPAPEPDLRVSTFELFTDLVFVFTITQLTTLVHDDPTATGLGRAALILAVIWWMYGGYAWLTNAVPPRQVVDRVLVFVGMAGGFVAALAIPDAFGSSGIAFGIAYLVVVLVHTVMFARADDAGARGGIRRIAPMNLAAALLVLAAGFVDSSWDWALWIGAVAVEAAAPFVTSIEGFSIRPAHFVERHGLVVLIALGESIVAIGVGLSGRPIDVRLVVAATLGLMVAVALWWSWFADDELGEDALASADGEHRPRQALYAFGYAFLPLLGGIVVLAAGVETALAHLDEHASPAGAWSMGAGAALFLVGEAAYRAALGLDGVPARLATGIAVLATSVIGLAVGGIAQLGALVVVLVAMNTIEHRSLARSSAPVA